MSVPAGNAHFLSAEQDTYTYTYTYALIYVLLSVFLSASRTCGNESAKEEASNYGMHWSSTFIPQLVEVAPCTRDEDAEGQDSRRVSQ
jgi:hypothetical protein